MNLFKTARSSLTDQIVCNYIIFIANAKHTSGYKMFLKTFIYEKIDDNFKRTKCNIFPST